MKFATYRAGWLRAHGPLVRGDEPDPRLLDLPWGLSWLEWRAGRPHDPATVASVYGGDLLGFIERAFRALPAAAELVELAERGALPESWLGRPMSHALRGVTLDAPLPRPPSLRDGYAFRQHVEAARKNRGVGMIPEFDQFPVFYFSNHHAVVGPGDVPVEPLHLDKLDFELEAAIVIGRRGKNLSAAEADGYVFGLTIMNDWSARGLQLGEMKLGLGPAKGKDFATSLGPWLVTIDELEDHAQMTPRGRVYDLAMFASVNGKRVSAGNLKDMTWTFAQIIERASYGVELFPGDVIGSGTVGTGCFLELNGSNPGTPQWLTVGDEVVLEIERLGALINRVVAANKDESDRADHGDAEAQPPSSSSAPPGSPSAAAPESKGGADLSAVPTVPGASLGASSRKVVTLPVPAPAGAPADSGESTPADPRTPASPSSSSPPSREGRHDTPVSSDRPKR